MTMKIHPSNEGKGKNEGKGRGQHEDGIDKPGRIRRVGRRRDASLTSVL